MITEDEIWFYAAACGWRATVEYLHAGESIRGVFLERGEQVHLWGPVGAVRNLSTEQFFAYLEYLEDCEHSSCDRQDGRK